MQHSLGYTSYKTTHVKETSQRKDQVSLTFLFWKSREMRTVSWHDVWSPTAQSKATKWAQRLTGQTLELLYMEALVFVHAPDNTSIRSLLQWKHTGKHKQVFCKHQISPSNTVNVSCKWKEFSDKKCTPSETVYHLTLPTVNVLKALNCL